MKTSVQGLKTSLVYLALFAACLPALAQGTAFNYEGKLSTGGAPANGLFDVRFSVYDSTNLPGTVVAGPLTNTAIIVSNGLFSATLDFGPSAFTGPARWLQLDVRTNGGDTFTTLLPRQPLLPTPYAIMANTASNVLGNVAASQLSGAIALAQLPAAVITNNQTGVTFRGVVAATNISASANQNFSIAGGSGGTLGGTVTIASGNAGIPTGGSGGNLNLQAGNAMAAGGGGYSGLGPAGAVNITAGAGYNSVGGNVTLSSGGNSPWTLVSNSFSKVSLQGVGMNSGDGAVLDVEGGHNTQYGSPPQYSAGGNVRVAGGSATGNFPGGNILLLPGTGTPNGNVSIGKTNPATALDVAGTVTATAFSGSGAALTSLTAGNISGTLTMAQLPAGLVTNNGSFAGNGASITNINIFSQYSAGALTQAVAPWSFVSNASYVVGSNAGSVATADFNGDGWLDLVSGNVGSKTLTVLTNGGAGVFGSNTSRSLTFGPAMVVAADINADGVPDLLASSGENNQLVVFINNGLGGLNSNATYNLPGIAYGFSVGDVNADGRPDLITGNYNAFNVSVLTNNGSGGFVLLGNYSIGSQYPRWVALADYNSDGRMDIGVANYFSPHNVAILTNSANTTFVYSTAVTMAGYALAVVAADVNGDSKPDLISSGSGGANVLSVSTNNGNGTFTSVVNYSTGPAPGCIAAADVNNDGKADILAVNGDSTVTVLTNNGAGVFVLRNTVLVGSAANYIATADVNTDGRLDLVSANYGTNTVSVFFNVAGASTVTFTGSGGGLTNIPPSAITGGLTTNIAVLVPGGGTNQLNFVNGILTAIQ
jgi:hypothetical protein